MPVPIGCDRFLAWGGGPPIRSVDLLRGISTEVAAWVDFELRSVEYYSLLAEISGRRPDTAAAEGPA